jgi:mycofactocin system transcriptional regulator
VASAALELFVRQGFDATTVDEIAAAVGVSRRTFFRYFDTKSDAVWGEFDRELARLAGLLAASPPDAGLLDALRTAVVEANRVGPGELGDLRRRVRLISSEPSLVAHSAVRYAAWCDVVAAFAAARMGADPGDLGPQTVARAALGAAEAAFVAWSGGEGDDLAEALDRAFGVLGTWLG